MSEYEEYRSILLDNCVTPLCDTNVPLYTKEMVFEKTMILKHQKNNIIIYTNTTIPKNEKKESEKE